MVLGAWLGPAGALDEGAVTLDDELGASVGASVADEVEYGICPVSVSDGDGDGSSVDDVLGVAVGVVLWTGTDDEDDGAAEPRRLAALGLQVAADVGLTGPDMSGLWVWFSVVPGPPLAWPPVPEPPPDEPVELELLGKIACCASIAT